MSHISGVYYTNDPAGHCRRSGVFIVNFEHISHLVLLFLLLTLSRQMPAGDNLLPIT